MPLPPNSTFRARRCGRLAGGFPRVVLGLMLLLTSLPGDLHAQETEDSTTTAEKKPDAQASKPDDTKSGAVEVEESKTKPKPSADVNLLASNLDENWKLFSSKEDTRLSDVWKVIDASGEKVLICTGTPKGFLSTKRQYKNFELRFEWKYVSDPNGNSGVLAFTKNEARLWPTSMQVQLHQPSAGSIFPSGDATSDNTTDANGLALEIGKWNSCRVVARDGKISVEINGKPAGEVSGCQPAQGALALQSEGSETHFRRVFIKELTDTQQSVADETATSLPTTKPQDPDSSVGTDG